MSLSSPVQTDKKTKESTGGVVKEITTHRGKNERRKEFTTLCAISDFASQI